MRVRRLLASVLFALIAMGGMRLQHLRRLMGDVAAEQGLRPLDPDQSSPQYRRFLDEVARTTRSGDRIALAVPARRWQHGYDFLFFRAVYLLPGRQVVPLITPTDELRLDRLAEAEYAAVWQLIPPTTGRFDRLWSAHGGTLVRRAR